MSVSQKVLVLGLGASGRTAARFYASRGFEVLAADTRPQPPKLEELQQEIANLRFLGAQVTPETAAEVSEVMISPGLSPEYSVFAPVVKEARQHGIPVVGEIELFARELKKLKAESGYAPKIIGITGTNGKTTTTMLSTAIIAEAGRPVVAAGNVGPNALGELEKHRLAGTLPDFWVLELSSFQLETTESLHCDSAALLNITEDHIDWHGSMEKYAAAKRKIFSADTVRVLNREDLGSMLSAEGVPSDLVHTFGSDAPKKIGVPYSTRLTEENAGNIIRKYDIVVDGCDNFATRYLINDICIEQRKPYVYGAICGFEGQVSVFNYGEMKKSYRDLYPNEEEMKRMPPPPKGVIGVTPAVVGSIEATEVLKIICGFGDILAGKLWTIDLRTLQSNKFSL